MRIGVNWAGVVATLTHQEVVDLAQGVDTTDKVGALVGRAAGAAAGKVAADVAKLVANVDLVTKVLVIWIDTERLLMVAVGKGSGVYLTLPWPCIINPFNALMWWLIIPTTAPAEAKIQSDWRWCEKCTGLFWTDNNPVGGVCPVGATHDRGPSSNYTLIIDDPTAAGQHDWRWCEKCAGMFWAGDAPESGTCPAGGAHKRGVSDYAVLMDKPNALGQNNWRWCHKCSGLFWTDDAPVGGRCPAGGAHERGQSSDYSLLMA
jgi:hypothetical protein